MRLGRAGFLAALIVGALVIAKEFPFDGLLHGRSAVAASVRELNSLENVNRALSQQIAQLQQPATIERIAHADYGLVAPGETVEMVMPSSHGSRSGSDPLADTRLPPSDFVPSDSAISTPPGTADETPPSGSFWSRLVNRLEFWKASS